MQCTLYRRKDKIDPSDLNICFPFLFDCNEQTGKWLFMLTHYITKSRNKAVHWDENKNIAVFCKFLRSIIQVAQRS